MAELRQCLEDYGFKEVSTYINSGNIIVSSDKSAKDVKQLITKALAEQGLDGEVNKALVLSHKQLQAVVAKKPKGFGEEPKTYHSDAIFLIDVAVDEAMQVFSPREGVDKVWPGPEVVYSQRLSAERTKSRLSKIMASPLYKSMTIRSWNTTVKLLDMLKND